MYKIDNIRGTKKMKKLMSISEQKSEKKQNKIDTYHQNRKS